MKRSYSSAFKAQVVLELLKETKMLNQLATEHSVHPNVLRTWREQALKDFACLFERRNIWQWPRPPTPSSSKSYMPRLAV